MDDLFLLVGKLYYDLVRSQTVIESLKKQLEEKNNADNTSNYKSSFEN